VDQLEAEPRALAHRRGRLCVVAHSSRSLNTERESRREGERAREGWRKRKLGERGERTRGILHQIV